MFIAGERFSLNIQTKSFLSKPLKLTPKRQQWQLGAALLNNVQDFKNSHIYLTALSDLLSGCAIQTSSF